MLSRVADALYWMGRYLERAEHVCRVIDIMAETEVEAGLDTARAVTRRAQIALGADPSENPANAADRLLHDKTDEGSVLVCVGRARDNARQVREHISTEMWERLNRLYLRVREEGSSISGAAPRDRVIEDLHQFAGAVDSTMSHGEGWRFLQTGRYLERLQLMARLISAHLESEADETFSLAQLLRMSCALEPYLRARTADVRRDKVITFLALDAEFPRSVRFCAANLRWHLSNMAPQAPVSRRAPVERLAGRLDSSLQFALDSEVAGIGGDPFLKAVLAESATLDALIHKSFVSYAVDDPRGV
jgi:uncharacterized alpha-E superfamily protein